MTELSANEMIELVKHSAINSDGAQAASAEPKKPRKKSVKLNLPGDMNDDDDEVAKSSGGVKKGQKKLNLINSEKVVKLIVTGQVFQQPTCTAGFPFYERYDKNMNGAVSCCPVCPFGKPMMIKGESFVCAHPKPCAFTISIKAFTAIVEHEYINPEMALKHGITLPKCNVCKGYSITTGGVYYGEETIVLRCHCPKKNSLAIMARQSKQDELIKRICESGVWNYVNLPIIGGVNGEINMDELMKDD